MNKSTTQDETQNMPNNSARIEAREAIENAANAVAYRQTVSKDTAEIEKRKELSGNKLLDIETSIKTAELNLDRINKEAIAADEKRRAADAAVNEKLKTAQEKVTADLDELAKQRALNKVETDRLAKESARIAEADLVLVARENNIKQQQADVDIATVMNNAKEALLIEKEALLNAREVELIDLGEKTATMRVQIEKDYATNVELAAQTAKLVSDNSSLLLNQQNTNSQLNTKIALWNTHQDKLQRTLKEIQNVCDYMILKYGEEQHIFGDELNSVQNFLHTTFAFMKEDNVTPTA